MVVKYVVWLAESILAAAALEVATSFILTLSHAGLSINNSLKQHVARCTALTFSVVEVGLCPPSGVVRTLPPKFYNAGVEAVSCPAGEADMLPTTLKSCNEQLLSNKNLTQQHVVRSTAVTASVVEAVPLPP
jgi:hypothetical protein